MKKHTIYELKNFLILWGTQSVSQLGSSMTAYALTLWLYEQTGSSLSTAALTICSYAPYVLMSIFAGVLTDQFDKKKIMLVCDSFSAVCTVSILALFCTGQLCVWHLYLLNAISGLMSECMKKLIALLLALVCVLGLVGCNTKSMDYIIENKPSVTGIVEEVHDDYIIMYSETAEGYPNGTNWSISLNVENKDSYTDIVVGDEIVVYYDGMAAETDPLQVGTVYAITLKTPADRTENAKTATIMVNGTNYYSTDNAVPVEVDESVIQYTTSYVENGIPQKDGEANFNKDLGTPYAVIEGDRVVVLMDNEWIEFKAK